MRVLSGCRVPAAAALKKAELSVLLTSDAHIRELNREWRGKDKATDVLSFPQLGLPALRALGRSASRGKVAPWELGDVVISLDRAEAQAREHGCTLQQELELLLAHGLLHLLGFDHELSVSEAGKMRRLETKLLKRSMIS